ncbi:uncharacterized protein LOC131309527 [Rhododendron vialii]|uniref:uncharacterized protein LOC131309527 n=1 Tax=Rhododendron vialii TaxID=182163 RepID=UPI00265FF2F9|nr:uncharacterized protein LOC131309527 [Rhododendron vialii]
MAEIKEQIRPKLKNGNRNTPPYYRRCDRAKGYILCEGNQVVDNLASMGLRHRLCRCLFPTSQLKLETLHHLRFSNIGSQQVWETSLVSFVIMPHQTPDMAWMTSENSSKNDPGWKYCEKVDPHNNIKLKCIFCNEVKNGGVSRIKQHLAGGAKRNTAACCRCPPEVRDEMREFIRKRDEAKSQIKSIPDFDVAMNDDDYDLDLDDDIIEFNPRSKKSSTHGSTTSTSIHSKPKKPRTIGPLDTYYTPEPEVVVENRKANGKQSKIDENEPYKKILKDRAHQAIARWIYDCGIPLNVVNNDSFAPMIEAIEQYGPEVEHVNKLMEEHKKDQEQYGCTLMSDGWTDRKNRTLMNLLVNSPRGTMFLKSMDASGIVKDAEMIYELLDGWVEHIGEANVVQVVTDSAAANVAAGRLLEAKRPHLFWSPCAAHCLDLMLEDIFKLPNLKTNWERAIMIHGYIYNRPSLLNMMRQFTKRRSSLSRQKLDLQPLF